MIDIKNEFLLKVGMDVRKPRVAFWDDDNTTSMRITNCGAWTDVGLWFRTEGCTYDAQGGCIMCDYSNGPHTTAEHIVSYVESGLQGVPSNCRNLLVSPSGSMLDKCEVPKKALIKILYLLKDSQFKNIFFETRAETITDNTISLCKSILGEQLRGLYVGLESAYPFIRTYCINKQLKTDSVINAMSICEKYGINIIFNVLIGIPFLSEEENIFSAYNTIKRVINLGASECNLFPAHVKRFTPLEKLYNANLYMPPSLWDMVETLNKLEDDVLRRVGLSWYTSNGAYNIVKSPETCPLCYNRILECFDNFSKNNNPEIIRELNLMKCSCRQKRKIEYTLSLPERIINGYNVLANQLSDKQYWQENKDAIKKRIYTDWHNTGGLYAL